MTPAITLTITIALLVAACVLLFAGARLWRRRWLGKMVALPVLLMGMALFGAGAYHAWLTHRPQPENIENRVLFKGVTYTRDVRMHPRPIVLHIVRVDLTAPGVSLLVTPGEPGTREQMPARTTSRFRKKFGAQVAINGSFFTRFPQPDEEKAYAPAGDPVFALGHNASAGVEYSPAREPYVSLYISKDNRVSIGAPPDEIHHAIAGWGVLLRGGQVPVDLPETNQWDVPNPRTAVAIANRGKTLLLVVADGRQPNYSEGLRLDELAIIIADYGGTEALNLDGGGSSTLVIEGDNGKSHVLNSPIHNQLRPGVERPVANHLGVFAETVK